MAVSYKNNNQGIPIVVDGTRTPFPSDFVASNVKKQDNYGLQLARAIYYSSISRSNALFYNDRALFEKYVQYSIGEQDEDKYKPLLKINPSQSNTSWTGSMNWAVKNYATKRLNIAVSKISEREYDPVVDALDQNAIDSKNSVKQRIKFYMDYKDDIKGIEEMLGGKSLAPEEVDPVLLPETSDELDLWMETNFKFKEASILEKGIIHHLDRNRYSNTKRLLAYDSFVLGVSVAYAGMDDNILPEAYRCNPADIIVPPTDREDFSDINYVGQILRVTVGDFYKMVGDSLPKVKVEELVEKYGTTNASSHFYNSHDRTNTNSFQDQTRIELMRFCYKSPNEMVQMTMRDKHGNDRTYEKEYDYYRSSKEQEKFKEKYPDRTLTRKKYWSVYDGYWVSGSDTVFRYDEMHHQERNRGNLSQTALPYKIFAPNIKNNRTVSTMKQIIPVLDELQSYHIKKQHVLANAIPAVWAIDLNALRNANFKWNNKDMTDQAKIEFLFQSGIFMFDSGDRHLPGSNYQPIRNLANSVANEVMMYTNLIVTALNEIDEIIGINKVTAASNLRPDTLKGTAEIQADASEVALDYLYRADRDISLEVIKSFGILTRQSIKYKTDGYYEKILPKKEVELLRNTPIEDFGYMVKLRPTASEWKRLYDEAMAAVNAGQIGWDDYIDLKAISTLKEAQNLFRVRVRKLRKDGQRAEVDKINANVNGQSQSNEQAHAKSMELEKMKAEMKMLEIQAAQALAEKQHEWKMEEIRLTKQLETAKDVIVNEEKEPQVVTEMLLKEIMKNANSDSKEKNANFNEETTKK
jgi:hypothetical protein